MISSPSPNPYVAPTALGPEALSPASHWGPRVLRWSLFLGAAYGVVAGLVTTVQTSFGLTRFGGLEYVPRILGLSAVRDWGPWGAALVPALTTVVVLHRAGRGATETPPIDRRLPVFVALTVAVLCPVVAAAGWLAGILGWAGEADARGGSGALLLRPAEGLLATDFAYGAVATLLQAVALAIAVHLAAASLLSRRWRLAPKLFVVWIALEGLAFGVGFLGRWFV